MHSGTALTGSLRVRKRAAHVSYKKMVSIATLYISPHIWLMDFSRVARFSQSIPSDYLSLLSLINQYSVNVVVCLENQLAS